MALSYELFNGTGSQTDFAVNKPFISRDHITLLVDDVSVTFTWVSDTLIRADSAPASGTLNVRVQRTTPDEALTDFENGSTLGEADLDRVVSQAIYRIQEITDNTESAMVQDSLTRWDARSGRIINLASPTASTDAANKTYVDNLYVASGNVPDPVDVTDDGKVLVANGGSWLWETLGAMGHAVLSAANTFTGSNVFSGGVTINSGASLNRAASGDTSSNIMNTSFTNLSGTRVANHFVTGDSTVATIWRFLTEGLFQWHTGETGGIGGTPKMSLAYDGGLFMSGATGGSQGLGSINAASVHVNGSSVSTPSGTIFPYAGATPPSGFLLSYGQTISRSTYANLFAAIGTTYGAGDGTTTFGLPDMRGRVIGGRDDMGGVSSNRLTGLSGGVDGDVLGDVGGSESHTLSESEIPAHTHTQTTVSATGTQTSFGSDFSTSGSAASATGSTGGDGAHNNVQPTIILNYIIKT